MVLVVAGQRQADGVAALPEVRSRHMPAKMEAAAASEAASVVAFPEWLTTCSWKRSGGLISLSIETITDRGLQL